MFVALALGMSGCGGVHASQTVSPASFFLPGIIKASPSCPTNQPVARVDGFVELVSNQ